MEEEETEIAATATEGNEGGSESETTEETPSVRSTVDVVRERRAELRGTAKPAAPAKQTDKAAASEGDDDEAPAAKAAAKDEKTPDFYSDDELVGKDLRNVDLKRVPPALRETVRKLQSSHDRAVQTANREREEMQQERKALQHSAKPKQEETEEEEDLPFTRDELAAVFKSKAGRAMLREVLQDEGLDVSEAKETAQQRIVNRAIDSATAKHPEMKDDKFFDDVVSAIDEDDDWRDAFQKNVKNPTVLATIFKAAAAQVKTVRAASEKKDVDADKERIKREKEKANAKPGSVAAKATKKGSSTPSTTVDFVRQRRAQLRGT